MRLHQSVMAWTMLFGVVDVKFGDYRASVNLVVALSGAIPDPLEVHVY